MKQETNAPAKISKKEEKSPILALMGPWDLGSSSTLKSSYLNPEKKEKS